MANPNRHIKCIVPRCRNTTVRTPEKMFFYLPTIDLRVRQNVMKVIRRFDDSSGAKTTVYCCEDHFDDDTDVESFIKYKLVEGKAELNRSTDPHKFVCLQEEDLQHKPKDKTELAVSTDSTAVPKLVPESPSVQADQCPKMSELDKLKRRLIRTVERLFVKERRAPDDAWIVLKQDTSRDCRELWDRMRSLTLKKLARLFSANDVTVMVPPIARMTATDWLMFDLVLVHEKIDVTHVAKTHKGVTAHWELLELVQKYEIFYLTGDRLAEAWLQLAEEYNRKGRECSVMLLQKRWYQIQAQSRESFYHFWREYRGNPRNLPRARDVTPSALHAAVAKCYPDIVTKHFFEWDEQIKEERIIVYDRFEELKKKTGDMPVSNSDEPELVLLEPNIETIDVEAYTETNNQIDSENKQIDDATKQSDKTISEGVTQTFPNEITNVKIKEEPVEIESDSEADADGLSNVKIIGAVHIPTHNEKESDSNQEAVATLTEENCPSGAIPQTTAKNTVSEEAVDTNKSTDAQSSIKQVAAAFSDMVVIKPEVFASLSTESSNVSNEMEISETRVDLPTAHVRVDQENETDDNEDDIIVINNDLDIVKTNQYDESMNGGKTTMVGLKQELLKDVLDMSSQDERTNVEKQSQEEVIKVVSNVSNTDEVTSEIVNPQLNTADFFEVGIEIIDDGIDEGIDDGEYLNCNEDQQNVSDNDSQAEVDYRNKSTFDLKLMMRPVIYMTKLDNIIDITQDEAFESIKSEPLIKMIEFKSKPPSLFDKHEIKVKSNPEIIKLSNNSEMVHNSTIEQEDLVRISQESSSENEEEIERVSINSKLFKKPSNRSYNPIQLCKNPDFNTRLKRLPVLFFTHSSNRKYLNKCKPLTIDLSKDFERKISDKTIYLKDCPKIETIENPEEDDIVSTNEFNDLAVENAISCIQNTTVHLPLEPTNFNIPDHINKEEVKLLAERKNKVISLPDIVKVRRLNQHLLTAEISPLPVKPESTAKVADMILEDSKSSNEDIIVIDKSKVVITEGEVSSLKSESNGNAAIMTLEDDKSLNEDVSIIDKSKEVITESEVLSVKPDSTGKVVLEDVKQSNEDISIINKNKEVVIEPEIKTTEHTQENIPNSDVLMEVSAQVSNISSNKPDSNQQMSSVVYNGPVNTGKKFGKKEKKEPSRIPWYSAWKNNTFNNSDYMDESLLTSDSFLRILKVVEEDCVVKNMINNYVKCSIPKPAVAKVQKKRQSHNSNNKISVVNDDHIILDEDEELINAIDNLSKDSVPSVGQKVSNKKDCCMQTDETFDSNLNVTENIVTNKSQSLKNKTENIIPKPKTKVVRKQSTSKRNRKPSCQFLKHSNEIPSGNSSTGFPPLCRLEERSPLRTGINNDKKVDQTNQLNSYARDGSDNNHSTKKIAEPENCIELSDEDENEPRNRLSINNYDQPLPKADKLFTIEGITTTPISRKTVVKNFMKPDSYLKRIILLKSTNWKCPLNLGRNTFLMTTARIQYDNQPEPTNVPQIGRAEIIPQMDVPEGIYFFLEPNGEVSCNIDPEIFDNSQLGRLPVIIDSVQKQLTNNVVIQRPTTDFASNSFLDVALQPLLIPSSEPILVNDEPIRDREKPELDSLYTENRDTINSNTELQTDVEILKNTLVQTPSSDVNDDTLLKVQSGGTNIEKTVLDSTDTNSNIPIVMNIEEYTNVSKLDTIIKDPIPLNGGLNEASHENIQGIPHTNQDITEDGNIINKVNDLITTNSSTLSDITNVPINTDLYIEQSNDTCKINSIDSEQSLSKTNSNEDSGYIVNESAKPIIKVKSFAAIDATVPAPEVTSNEPETSKKSILSDLMEMSGISAEDTLPQPLKPQEIETLSNIIPYIQQMEIQPSVPVVNVQNVNVNPVVSLYVDPNVIHLTPVFTLDVLKLASDQGAQFYKFDLNNGFIVQINVAIEKRKVVTKSNNHLNCTQGVIATNKASVDLSQNKAIISGLVNDMGKNKQSSQIVSKRFQKGNKKTIYDSVDYSVIDLSKKIPLLKTYKQKTQGSFKIHDNGIKVYTIKNPERPTRHIIENSNYTAMEESHPNLGRRKKETLTYSIVPKRKKETLTYSILPKRKRGRPRKQQIEAKIDLMDSDDPMEEEYLIESSSNDSLELVKRGTGVKYENSVVINNPPAKDIEIAAKRKKSKDNDLSSDDEPLAKKVMKRQTTLSEGDKKYFDCDDYDETTLEVSETSTFIQKPHIDLSKKDSNSAAVSSKISGDSAIRMETLMDDLFSDDDEEELIQSDDECREKDSVNEDAGVSGGDEDGSFILGA